MTSETQSCPECGTTVDCRPEQPPWCPDCEWNLAAIHFQDGRDRGRFGRRARLRAFALDARIVTRIA